MLRQTHRRSEETMSRSIASLALIIGAVAFAAPAIGQTESSTSAGKEASSSAASTSAAKQPASQKVKPDSSPAKAFPRGSQPSSQPAKNKTAGAGGKIELIEDGGKIDDKDRKPRKGEIIESGTRLRPKRALVGIEIAPGVAIPFKRYLDFGSGNSTYFMENGSGFSIAISLTLDNVELRYHYTSLSAGRVKGQIPRRHLHGAPGDRGAGR
jgi:hypothetical protein